MKKIVSLLLALTLTAGSVFAQASGAMITFGLISDTHVCDKPDQSTTIALNASPRYFTGGLAKIEAFATAMNAADAEFVAELGDFTDNPATPGLTPAQRREAAMGFMRAAEATFALFDGPRYHVFGNHDTDQVSKADFMSVVRNTGISPDTTYYSFDKSGVHFIVLDASGKVLAVFSGHYHDGGYQEINGIKYIVVQANAAYGNDVSYHNQYSTVKIFAEGNKYTLALSGNGLQKSYAFSKVLY
jgi:predicted phosphodiesterase